MAAKTFSFKSEVQQLLEPMIHSLYSNREIFLRELISNGSDAIERLRLKSLSDPQISLPPSGPRLRIWVDRNAKQLHISDNGCGMTQAEVVEQLGTIAHSGTKKFLEIFDEQKRHGTIGQFGVGFYSTFTVASHVAVHTRAADTEEAQGVRWSSEGQGTFNVEACPKSEPGTIVSLTLKEDAEEFLEHWKLKNLITQYANHLALPIELQVVEQSGESRWEQINRAQALWTRNKQDISAQEYREFYKELTYDDADPLAWAHRQVEGTQSYTMLLYIPSHPGLNLWAQDVKKGVKLYVQRVFILEDASLFLPPFLSFVRGVVDSNDLPLNVSREMIQHNRVTAQLRTSATQRVLHCLQQLAEEEPEHYEGFWNAFGGVLKQGVADSPEYRDRLLALLRFTSTAPESVPGRVTLKEYVARMQPDQKAIYVLLSDNVEAARHNPLLEWYQQQGLEVLLLTDKIDPWMLTYLSEFEGHPVCNIAQSEAKDTVPDVQDEPLVQRFQEVLQDRVKAVRSNTRLLSVPCAVTTLSGTLSPQMARLLTSAGARATPLQFMFEFDPSHPLIQKLKHLEGSAESTMWIELLFEEALLAEQGRLANPHRLIATLNRLLAQLPLEAIGEEAPSQ